VPCGAYHVAFLKKGITIQMRREDVRGLLEATGTALRVAEAEDRGKELASRGDGTIIN
jgi:hypothetical protein